VNWHCCRRDPLQHPAHRDRDGPRIRGPSLLGDEPFRRPHRLGAEIVVPGAGYAHEALGRPLAERHGNDSVVVAVHHQHRRLTLPARKSERNWSFMKSRTGTNQ
jgi:hypothetical protein